MISCGSGGPDAVPYSSDAKVNSTVVPVSVRSLTIQPRLGTAPLTKAATSSVTFQLSGANAVPVAVEAVAAGAKAPPAVLQFVLPAFAQVTLLPVQAWLTR